MKTQELHCLVIRSRVGRYPALVQTLSKFSDAINIELIDNDPATVSESLNKQTFGLVFLFQENGLSVDVLAELMRKNGSESILISLNDKKPQSTLLTKRGTTGVQICNLHYNPSGSTSNLALKFLIQYAFLKTEFRTCKSLLRVSEQRCHWLVDSSSEAVAYIGQNLHLYANQTYLNLFSYDSLHRLKITPVSELILEDEREIFFDFVNQYDDQTAQASALIVTLRPLIGTDFRASIRLIPTVFSGTRCYQLWIRKLGSSKVAPLLIDGKANNTLSPATIIDSHHNYITSPRNNDASNTSKDPQGIRQLAVPQIENSFIGKNNMLKDKTSKQSSKRTIMQPLAIINRQKTKNLTGKKPQVYNKLLKQILSNNQVALMLSKLDMLKQNKILTRQYMVDLDVPAREYNSINSILSKQHSDVFWDQVMILLLLQRLQQTGSKGMKLLIPLTESVLLDDVFKQWLNNCMLRFKGDISNCVFLFPQLPMMEAKKTRFENFSQQGNDYSYRLGIDNFEINKQTKAVLNIMRPEFVRFSKKGVMSTIKNRTQALALLNTIKILEKNNIKVIAPYDSCEKMKQLFDMGGASFCQKQTVS
jgi:PAS domain-containing protein